MPLKFIIITKAIFSQLDKTTFAFDNLSTPIATDPM